MARDPRAVSARRGGSGWPVLATGGTPIFFIGLPERGWVLRHEGMLAGFMALIPAVYAVGGVFTPAMNASTWWRGGDPSQCQPAHADEAASPWPPRCRWRTLTPTPDAGDAAKSGWMPATSIQRHFVPLGSFGLPWRAAGRGCRRQKITRDPGRCGIARNFQNDHRESGSRRSIFRWFAASTMRQHEFIGVLDEAGCPSSYLFLTPADVRGVSGWLEVDHFSTCEDFTGAACLVGEIVRNRARLNGGLYLT